MKIFLFLILQIPTISHTLNHKKPHNPSQKPKSQNLNLPTRHLELTDKIHPNSGVIKLGQGNDFDPTGKIIQQAAGGASGGAGGGGASGDPIPVNFLQPTIKDQYDDQTAYISFPDQVMAPSYKQGPIVFSPEILYPNIKKRVIIHHEKAFKQFYKDMMGQSHYWVNFANMNPYYKSAMSKFETHKFPYHSELAEVAKNKEKEMLNEMKDGRRRII